ncbi:hypothetical protein SANTM175S_02494 [Streptomyces antimycoticus]
MSGGWSVRSCPRAHVVLQGRGEGTLVVPLAGKVWPRADFWERGETAETGTRRPLPSKGEGHSSIQRASRASGAPATAPPAGAQSALVLASRDPRALRVRGPRGVAGVGRGSGAAARAPCPSPGSRTSPRTAPSCAASHGGRGRSARLSDRSALVPGAGRRGGPRGARRVRALGHAARPAPARRVVRRVPPTGGARVPSGPPAPSPDRPPLPDCPPLPDRPPPPPDRPPPPDSPPPSPTSRRNSGSPPPCPSTPAAWASSPVTTSRPPATSACP